MTLRRRYFDHNATTPLSQAAKAALVDAIDVFGNPSSVHAEGRMAKALLQKARRQVAERLNASPDHVVFTSGASEAAVTLLTPYYKMGRSDVIFSQLYIGATEHPCIAEGGRFPKKGITTIGVDENGVIQLEQLKHALEAHDKTTGLPLVAIQAANGETGVIQPVREIADIVSRVGGVLIVDIVQYVGKLPVDINTFGGDFFIVAAHKIGGPKGIGAFVANGGMLMPTPLIVAGGQERGLRSGTEAMPLIASFGAAMADQPSETETHKLNELQRKLEYGLRELSNGITIFGQEASRLTNTTYFALTGTKAETMQIGFDLAGFAVSAGSACSSGKVKQSGVLAAMGANAPDGAIRVSIGRETTDDDINDFLQTMEKMVRTAKK